MRKLILGVAEFLFGVDCTGFPGVTAECEVASLDLQGFVDFFAGGGACLPAVPTPKEFGYEDAWRGEEQLGGIGRWSSRIHGVISQEETNQNCDSRNR